MELSFVHILRQTIEARSNGACAISYSLHWVKESVVQIRDTDESSVNADANQGSNFSNQCSQGNACTNEGDNLVNIAADGNDIIQAIFSQLLTFA